jgi:hypothetical protein
VLVEDARHVLKEDALALAAGVHGGVLLELLGRADLGVARVGPELGDDLEERFVLGLAAAEHFVRQAGV